MEGHLYVQPSLVVACSSLVLDQNIYNHHTFKRGWATWFCYKRGRYFKIFDYKTVFFLLVSYLKIAHCWSLQMLMCILLYMCLYGCNMTWYTTFAGAVFLYGWFTQFILVLWDTEDQNDHERAYGVCVRGRSIPRVCGYHSNRNISVLYKSMYIFTIQSNYF